MLHTVLILTGPTVSVSTGSGTITVTEITKHTNHDTQALSQIDSVHRPPRQVSACSRVHSEPRMSARMDLPAVGCLLHPPPSTLHTPPPLPLLPMHLGD